MTKALAIGVITTAGSGDAPPALKALQTMVTTTQFAGIGVHVYRRDADGIEISIINNAYITTMYGPKGRKHFLSLFDAQQCAFDHGFRPVIEHEFLS